MRPGLTGRIARTAAARPWLTLGLWLVALVAAGAAAGSVNDYITPVQTNLIDTDADRADAIDQQYRLDGNAGEKYAEQLVITSDTLTAESPDFRRVIDGAVAALNKVDGVVPVDRQAATVSPNGLSVLIDVTMTEDTEVLTAAMDAVDATATDQVDAFVAGPDSTQIALNQLANQDLARGEGIGIAVALVVLLFVFGAVVAAGLPILVAIGSIVVATGLGAIASRILADSGTVVSDSLVIFIGMMGLALGIDYSLLTVQRFREELAKGRTVIDAVTITGDTANRAVLTSGLVVVASIGGLMLLPQNTFFGIGVAIIAVAIAAVATALFVLPAVLRLLGSRVNTWRLPMRHPGETSRGWTRIARWVAGRPGAAAALGIVVLTALAAPALSIKFALPGPDAWPDDFVLAKADAVYREDFGFTSGSTMVAVTGATEQEVRALAEAIDADRAFEAAEVDIRDGAMFIDAHDTFASADAEAAAGIERLRNELIPAHITSADATAFVGGASAAEHDNLRLIQSAAPWSVAFILTVTFVLLMIMFRSVVVPVKAILMNLIGTTATFGMLVAAYQWGWGEVIGLPRVNGISPYMPVMVFALVFGLSMDYHVFLLSRIRERYSLSLDTRGAVIEGVARTGPLITGAALIMIGVFGGFASASIPELSQWGFGLAAGVLLDATIIRILLVPAAMTWLGRANWYLPSWLEWLPKVRHHAPDAPARIVAAHDQPHAHPVASAPGHAKEGASR